MRMKLVFILISLFIFSSCGIFRSAPERPSRPQVQPRKEKKVEKKKPDEKEKSTDEKLRDNIKKKDSLDLLNEEKDSVIDFRRKDQYSIELILPLVPLNEGGLKKQSDDNARSSSISKEKLLPFNQYFIEYLSGFTLALEEGKENLPGFNFKLHVSSSGDFDALLDDSSEWSFQFAPDLILGGIKPSSVDVLTSLSSQENIYYISPWITSTPYSENPLFLQLTPGLPEYLYFLADHVATDSIYPTVTILTHPDHRDRVELFSEYFQKEYPDSPFYTWIADDFFDDQKKPVELPDWMKEETPQAIIVAMDRGESFLFNALSYLSNHEEWQGEIYGFSAWQNIPLLREFFENGNIHLVSHTAPSRVDSSYINFEEKYFEKYQTLPNSWSVKGYDHATFIACGLSTYGLDFYGYLDQIGAEGIQHFFDFNDQQDEQLEGIQMLPLVNNGIKLLHYRDHLFRLNSEK